MSVSTLHIWKIAIAFSNACFTWTKILVLASSLLQLIISISIPILYIYNILFSYDVYKTPCRTFENCHLWENTSKQFFLRERSNIILKSLDSYTFHCTLGMMIPMSSSHMQYNHILIPCLTLASGVCQMQHNYQLLQCTEKPNRTEPPATFDCKVLNSAMIGKQFVHSLHGVTLAEITTWLDHVWMHTEQTQFELVNQRERCEQKSIWWHQAAKQQEWLPLWIDHIDA